MVTFSMLAMSTPAEPEVLLSGSVAWEWSFLNFAVAVEYVSVSRMRGDDIVVWKRLCCVFLAVGQSSAVVSSNSI